MASVDFFQGTILMGHVHPSHCDLCGQIIDVKNQGIVLPCSHTCHLECFMLFIRKNDTYTVDGTRVKRWYIPGDPHQINDVEIPLPLYNPPLDLSAELNENVCPLHHPWDDTDTNYSQWLSLDTSPHNQYIQTFDIEAKVIQRMHELAILREFKGRYLSYYYEIMHGDNVEDKKKATEWMNYLNSLFSKQPFHRRDLPQPIYHLIEGYTRKRTRYGGRKHKRRSRCLK